MSFLRALRPTLLDRYVVREVVPPTGLGLLLFTFILLLDQISQLIKILVTRGADLGTVGRAFLYILPSMLAITIPMAFLLGVLLALGRMASDGEIVALRASGVSPAVILRPVMAVAVAAGAVTFYVFSVLGPQANQAYREVVFGLIVSKARTGMSARVFNDDLIPGTVLYVSDIDSATGEWKDVFLHDDRDPAKPKVILARLGHLEIDKRHRLVQINLQQGVIHTFTSSNSPDPSQYDALQFQSRDWPLPFEQFFPNLPLAKGDREMSLGELRTEVRKLRAQGRGRMETGRYEVEYQKKFAIPAACLVFGLLGLGLSLGSKKEARSAAFGLSLAVIFIYYVLIRLGEQAGDTGMLSPVTAMWSANVVLGGLALTLLGLNHQQAAFDPLDPAHYAALLPYIRRRPRARAVAARPARVVVIRIPRWRLPLPGLLDRYIAKMYVGKFALVLIAFWSLFVLVDFMNLFDDIQQNRIKGNVVLRYYAFYTPQVANLITPVAVLVAVLATFGILARRNEITAMKAAGLSVYRATMPALALGALASLAMFAAGEYVLPSMNRVANQYQNQIKGRPPQSSSLTQKRWALGSDSRLYHYDYAENKPEMFKLYGLSVYDVDPRTWTLRDRLYALRASWNGVGYDLEQGWRTSFGQARRFHAFSQMRTRELEPPSYFRQEEREAETLRYAELKTQITNLEALGLDVIPLQVKLHSKIAFPVVCVVMTLIGIPFAFVVARRGALYGIGVSVLIAIVYWASLHIFDALGASAKLPPLLAAWAPDLIFAAVALYLMLMLET